MNEDVRALKDAFEHLTTRKSTSRRIAWPMFPGWNFLGKFTWIRGTFYGFIGTQSGSTKSRESDRYSEVFFTSVVEFISRGLGPSFIFSLGDFISVYRNKIWKWLGPRASPIEAGIFLRGTLGKGLVSGGPNLFNICACWLCFWIAFFRRNDFTDFYDFWHILKICYFFSCSKNHNGSCL